ncbi:MAG TPA: bifunctional fucokinase/L-fucose-1-P-guanylyltransferase, partial [Armatimonadota bacterium]|nr:bifunctional fucokinase/L-fucose-1-P-guanylyltransferase [Armatimonadota bacterium]
MQFLISLPPTSASLFAEMTGRRPPEWFATADPAGRRVGSGGGTAHTLVEAWRATGSGMTLEDWLRASRKLVLHGGGHSRRLPAYAPVGKPLIPIPVQRGSYGQRLDQTLLDLQL